MSPLKLKLRPSIKRAREVSKHSSLGLTGDGKHGIARHAVCTNTNADSSIDTAYTRLARFKRFFLRTHRHGKDVLKLAMAANALNSGPGTNGQPLVTNT